MGWSLTRVDILDIGDSIPARITYVDVPTAEGVEVYAVWGYSEDGETADVIRGMFTVAFLAAHSYTPYQFAPQPNQAGLAMNDTLTDAISRIDTPIPVHTNGNAFDGWSLTEGGVRIDEASLLSLLGQGQRDITVWARWQGLSVTYSAQGADISTVPAPDTGLSSGVHTLATQPVPIHMDNPNVLFIGWSLRGDIETLGQEDIAYLSYVIDSVLLTDEDVTVYAVWGYSENGTTPDVLDQRHTVRFHMVPAGHGYSGTLVQQVLNGGDAVPPIPAERVGYQWAWEGDYTNVTTNREIWLVWTRVRVTVGFHANGGTFTPGDTSDIIREVVATSGNLFIEPRSALTAAPTRVHPRAEEGFLYEFGGWYRVPPNTVATQTEANRLSANSVIPNQNMSAYARWNELAPAEATHVSIIFRPNNGAESSFAWNIANSYDPIYQRFPLVNPVRTGYDFIGWFPVINPTTEALRTELIRHVNRDHGILQGSDSGRIIYLEARWERQEANLNFHANGGSFGPENDSLRTVSVHLGDFYATAMGQVAPPTLVARTHPLEDLGYRYTFAGWFVTPSGEPHIVSATEVIEAPPLQNVAGIYTRDLYARWRELTPPPNGWTTLVFQSGGGASNNHIVEWAMVDNTPITADAAYAEALFIRPGYTFDGWILEAPGMPRVNPETATIEELYYLSGHHVILLIAQWIPETYKVIYNLNGGNAGTGPGTAVVGVNQAHILSETPVPTHPNIMVNGEDTAVLFLGWSRTPQEILGIGDREVLATVQLRVVRSTGPDEEVYAIWGLSRDGETADLFRLAHTVRFLIEPNQTYTGTLVQTVLDGGDAIPPIPTERAGYSWHWEGNYTNVRSDWDVWLVWTRARINVTFNASNDIRAGTFTVGLPTDVQRTHVASPGGWFAEPMSSLAMIPTASPANNPATGIWYEFAGWYRYSDPAQQTNANRVTAETIISIDQTEDIQLYARWVRIPPPAGNNHSNIIWRFNNGEESYVTREIRSTGNTFLYRPVSLFPPDPVRDNHVFLGWFPIISVPLVAHGGCSRCSPAPPWRIGGPTPAMGHLSTHHDVHPGSPSNMIGLEARWGRAEGVVHFHANGGDFANGDLTSRTIPVYLGDTFSTPMGQVAPPTLRSPEHPEAARGHMYIFAGWFTGPEVDARMISATDIITTAPAGGMELVNGRLEMHLYAHWIELLSPAEGYTTLVFQSNGGALYNYIVEHIPIDDTQIGTFKPADGLFTRPGYTLSHWIIDSEIYGVHLVTDLDTIAHLFDRTEHDIIVLIAQWTRNQYQVHYRLNGGNPGGPVPNPVEVPTNDTHTLGEDPRPTHPDVSVNGSDTAVLFIGWSRTPLPILTGDDGWYLAKQVREVSSTGPDVYVYAIWGISSDGITPDVLLERYVVIYDIRSGIVDTGPEQNPTVALQPGHVHTLSTQAPEHAPIGDKIVVFVGWSRTVVSEILTGLPEHRELLEEHSITSVEIVDRDITVYAIWGFDSVGDGIADVNRAQFSIIYDVRSGIEGSGPVEETGRLDGNTYYLSMDPVPTHEDVAGRAVRFIGWSLQDDLGIFTAEDTALLDYLITSVSIDGANRTVYAVWGYATDGETADVLRNRHTVRFYMPDGSFITQQLVLTGGDATAPTEANLNIPVGYELAGWDRPLTNIREDLSIYAILVPRGITITFSENFGTDPAYQTGTARAGGWYAGAMVDIVNPVRVHETEGYQWVFMGWYLHPTQQTAENRVTAGTAIAVDAGDHTVYARWVELAPPEPDRTHLVFRGMGGSPLAYLVLNVALDESPIGTHFPDVYWADHNFEAWFTIHGIEIEATDEIGAVYAAHAEARVIILYAHWQTEPQEAQVSFVANGGEGTMAAVTVTVGELFTLPENEFTAPEGYHFAGWVVSGDTPQAGTTPLWPGLQIQVDGDVVLTAQWQTAGYWVRYDANGGIGTPPAMHGPYAHGTIMTAPMSGMGLSRPGFIQVGWRLNSPTGSFVIFGGNYMLQSNTVLYAAWVVLN